MTLKFKTSTYALCFDCCLFSKKCSTNFHQQHMPENESTSQKARAGSAATDTKALHTETDTQPFRFWGAPKLLFQSPSIKALQQICLQSRLKYQHIKPSQRSFYWNEESMGIRLGKLRNSFQNVDSIRFIFADSFEPF